MKGTEAVSIILSMVGDVPVVNANGFLGREAFKARDREGNFYMIGSMGLASSIGLGVALCKPDRKVVVLDGDGNVLMAMGTLAMISAEAPKNLVHVVIDNRVYESTGKQKTLSASVKLEDVARGTGYKISKAVSDPESLKKEMKELMQSDGPSFLLVRTEASFDKNTGRVIHTPEEIKRRFIRAVARH
tara:strand:- start:17618 stop:18181 length:564 start_codon:yes stop_codon:yes gene_type:complete